MISLILFLVTAVTNDVVFGYSYLQILSGDCEFQHIIFNISTFLSKHRNFSANSKTNKFVSQQLKLNWVDSVLYCKSNGMRLAKLSNEAVYDVLQQLKSYQKQELYFDGSDLIEPFHPSACTLINATESNMFNLVKTASCIEKKRKFLCEQEKIVENEKKQTARSLEENDAISEYFKRIGTYGESFILIRKQKSKESKQQQRKLLRHFVCL